MNTKRIKKLFMNTGSSLIFQIVTIICGFVLPRLILTSYGSDVNGLVNSITQFLAIISFMDLGVGEVVRSSFYKPLADNDSDEISKIYVSGSRFFKQLALILLVYVAILTLVFPIITEGRFGFFYTAVLVIAMSVSSFMQYYFGTINSIFLSADQKSFLYYNVQTITLILNTIVCSILMILGFSIQFVRITTALIYLVRPLYLRWYVDRHYSINRKIKYEDEPIKQKWNGLAQHISTVILNHTDTIILTLMGTLSQVSIYSVYHMIVYGIKDLFDAITPGIKPLLGELWVKQEKQELEETFSWIEWCMHTAITFCFGCMAFLIVPFVTVYTNGITDANYVQPVFGYLLTLAYAIYCIRLPYNMMILAAGHFKQTQGFYIATSLINIVISVILVNVYGLIGVAIGTLFAMIFQTVWTVWYNSFYLIKRPVKIFIKQICIDIISVLISSFIAGFYSLSSISYIDWFILALQTGFSLLLVILIINIVFYHDRMLRLLKSFIKLFSK